MQAISAWARKDPQSAIAWATADENNTDRTLRNISAVESILLAWSAKAPQEATDWIDRSGRRIRPSTIGQISEAWARQNPGLAFAWANSQEERTTRSRALLAVASVTRDARPEQLIAWARDVGPSGSSVVSTIIKKWQDLPPQTAVAMAETIESPSSRGDSLATLASNWSEKDMNGTRNWVDKIADDHDRSHALMGIVFTLATSDQPVEAASLVASIPDETVRRYASRDLINLIKQEHPGQISTVTEILRP
jgi:hypothetical protein